jgi:peptidoglycan/LPS O-acetylase OafA/YrhL
MRECSRTFPGTRMLSAILGLHRVSMGADQIRVPLAVSAGELAGVALIVLAVTLLGWEPTRSEWGVMFVCTGALVCSLLHGRGGVCVIQIGGAMSSGRPTRVCLE